MFWLYPVLSFLGALIGAWLISFLQEKGKNYATKSDIGEITEKVESIKSDFVKDQEIQRAKLSLLVDSQSGANVDMKKAVYEFWDSFILLYSLCDNLRGDIDEERLSEFAQFERDIERTSKELKLKHARLFFLISDDTLLDLSDSIFSNVTKQEGRFILFLVKARPWFEKMDSVNKKQPFNIEEYNRYWDQLKKLEDEFEKSIEELVDKIEVDSEAFKLRAHQVLFPNPNILKK